MSILRKKVSVFVVISIFLITLSSCNSKTSVLSEQPSDITVSITLSPVPTYLPVPTSTQAPSPTIAPRITITQRVITPRPVHTPEPAVKIFTDGNRAKELLNNPEEVTLYNQKYRLSTELFRDFTTGSPDAKGGNPLVAIAKLTGKNNTLPNTIYMEKLWVIKGDTIWEADFSYEDTSKYLSDDVKLCEIAHHGPFWDAGTNVGVVLRLFDISSKEYFYVKATNQIITRKG